MGQSQELWLVVMSQTALGSVQARLDELQRSLYVKPEPHLDQWEPNLKKQKMPIFRANRQYQKMAWGWALPWVTCTNAKRKPNKIKN